MNDYELTAEEAVVRFDREAEQSDGRSIIIRLVRWGEVAETPQGRETFMRGAFADVKAEDIHIEAQRHDGAIVGRGEYIEEAADGAYLRARVSETSDGNDLLTLVGDGTIDRASISFKPSESHRRADGVIERVKANIRRVAVLPRGAYPSAQVLAVRSETVSESVTTEQVPEVAPEPVNIQPILDRLDQMDEAIGRAEASAMTTADPTATDDRSVYDVLASTRDTDEAKAINRVLAENNLADNDGLILPGNYIGKLLNPIRAQRNAIMAFGGPASLPSSGMTFEYIEFDKVGSTGHEALVAPQAAEYDEVNSGTFGWDQKSLPIKTRAGGAAMSWQLLRRSSPAYRDLLMERFASEFGYKTEADFVATIVAQGTADTFTLGADSTVLLGKLFDQSLAIKTETGVPASIVMASDDVFAAVGKLADIVPYAYGTQNLPGVAQASSLRINVSGLEIVNNSHLANGTMVTAAPQAAKFHEDGPRIDTDEIPKTLSSEAVIWGFGATAVYQPAAIYVSTVTLV